MFWSQPKPCANTHRLRVGRAVLDDGVALDGGHAGSIGNRSIIPVMVSTWQPASPTGGAEGQAPARAQEARP